MKRRSRAGDKPIKRQRRKTPEPNRRHAPKAVERSNSSPTGEETDVARLARELNEAREQQTATSEVLQVISTFAVELDPVFQAIVTSATRLCEAKYANLYLFANGAFQLVSAALALERLRDPPIQPTPGTGLGRMIKAKATIQIADVLTDQEYPRNDPLWSMSEREGVRTLLCVPMIKESELIGAISIFRQEVRPFSDKQIELVKNFAAEAVIAIENARLLNELRQSLEQQTATAEVLRVISSSPSDLDPVFRTMLMNATRLCEADFGQMLLYQGDGVFRNVAMHNAPPAFAELREREPMVRASGTLASVITTKQCLHIADCTEDASYKRGDADFVRFVDLCGARTLLGVPMLKGKELIGVIGIYRQEVRPFAEKQIALLKSFAAQAVIAIENTRLLNELRQSLEQQTATSQVLQVISSSPGDLKSVFQAMLENATRICEAKFGVLYLYDDTGFEPAALSNAPPTYEQFVWARGQFFPQTGNGLDRLLQTREVIHSVDEAAERVPTNSARLAGARSQVLVPMLKDGKLAGAIAIYRQEVRPFSDKQIALLSNFAAQAVIAIENTRLLNELRQRTTDLTERTADLTEALEQQTATSEVLQVISSSPGDLQPVFAAMLENAVRICDAKFGNIYRWDGDALHMLASHNTPPAFAEDRRRSPYRPYPNSPIGRMVADKTLVHVSDVRTEDVYTEQLDPVAVTAVTLGGTRTLLGVPLLNKDETIGAFFLSRQEVRPFSAKQIELVKNFAAQAVVAVENTRLLGELRESLQQQTATADVLKIISRSTFDPQVVLNTLVESAAQLCEADMAAAQSLKDSAYEHTAAFGLTPEQHEHIKTIKFEPGRGTITGRILLTGNIVQVHDLRNDPEYTLTAVVESLGARTIVGVPLLREGTAIGVFVLMRRSVRPFTARQIELLSTYADQAVIAIENVRLLNELRETLERQTATSEVLQVINSSPGDLQPVFMTMLENAVRICDAKWGTIHRWDGDALHLMATHNLPPAFAEVRGRTAVYRPHPKSMFGRMFESREAVHFADSAAQPAYTERLDPVTIAAVELGRVRTVVGVPMLKENKLIGAFAIARQEVRPFTDKQIEMVQNFAAQAVIAIENTRLLNELRERTAQLEVRSQEVVKLNQQLEHRVADQVGEIERMGRLRRFLPPQVADLIVASGTEKQLESHRREITALFCDLRGFTGFSESSDPEDVMALLRDYHASIGETIIKYSGTLERYAGDGVMVVFNDPVPVEKPALQAVLMALEMREVIGALTEKWRRLGHDIGFGIGIAHGFATLGTIGFEGRFDYAAIGTVSNVASRLCDEAKPGQILISPRVLMAVENAVTVEPVGEFALKGIRRPLAAHNVLAAVSSKIE